MGIYHDKAPYGINHDYDATSWLATFNGNTASIDMLLSEFQPDQLADNGVDVNLLFCFVFEDGTVADLPGYYQIENGLPNVDIDIDASYTGFGSQTLLDKKDWKIAASSFNGAGTTPEKLIDGDLVSSWHNRWLTPVGVLPYVITVDMGAEQTLHGIVVHQRPDVARMKVYPKLYTIETSVDGSTWKDEGSFSLKITNRPQEQPLAAAVQARYFRMTITAIMSSKNDASFAELNAY